MATKIYGCVCFRLMSCYAIRFASDFFIDLCLVDIALTVQLRRHGAVLSRLIEFDLIPFY